MKNNKILFWGIVLFALVWNVFGVYQFLGSLNDTTESLMAMGMTLEQAQVYSSYPTWMTIAFAFGTFGGLIGTVLLALRKRLAVRVFLISLVGYVLLYIGDITEGVFQALGSSQVIVLTFVVLIAAGLWWYSKKVLQ